MLLPRPELTTKILYAAATHNLTVITAPMGYGKTTLARVMAEKLPGETYYYAVPAGPHDGYFVWRDMCVSLEAQGLSIAPALRRLGLPERASQVRQALDLLWGLSAQGGACLILDDYHHMADALMDAFWERRARESILNLRLILLSRSIPDVNLQELRLKGHAALFEQDLLVFSQEETEAFFRTNGVENPAAAAESQRYSEGWPAVLWLCLQSWLNNGRLAVSAVSGDMDSLLANAVFSTYSSDERDLLLRLSVFPSFRKEDAEKIAAEAGWLPVSLMELRQKNTLLSCDAQTECYQFHSIFREFLRKRLAVTAHIDKPSLYRLAGECCFARNDLVSAFRLFHQAGRDEDLSRLLDTFWHFTQDRNLFYFAEERFHAASIVPWRVRLQNPLGWLAFVALYSLTWNDQRTALLLDETEERFRAAGDIPDTMKQRLQGEIEFVRAFLSFNEPGEKFAHYTEAVRLLNGPSRFAGEDFPWNCGVGVSFFSLRDPGTYGALVEGGQRLLHLHNTLSGGKTQDCENILYAECLLERGDFSGAEPLFTEMLDKCRDDGRRLMGVMNAVFGLARCLVASGNAEKALSVLEAVRPLFEARDLIEFFDAMDLAQAYVHAVLGNLDAIPRWLREGEMLDPPHDVMPHLFGFSLAIHGKALLLQGEYQRLQTIARSIPHAAPLMHLFSRIHGKILEALAAWRTQGQSDALKLLGEALDLSRPDGIILPLAEYGAHILPLLRLLKRYECSGESGAHRDAVMALAQRVARLAASPAKARKDLLTPREQEVMRYVAQGETNPAIAGQLHISVNAVKALLSKASAKLGAFNRAGAAQRFAELYGATWR